MKIKPIKPAKLNIPKPTQAKEISSKAIQMLPKGVPQGAAKALGVKKLKVKK